MLATRDERSGMSTEVNPARLLVLAGLVLLGAMSFAPPEAKAAEDWHVGGAAGSGMPYDPWAPRNLSTDLEPELPESGNLSYGLQPLRTQGEGLQDRLALDNWQTDGLSPALTPDQRSTTGLMAKGYYDLAITPRWRLFAGAGMGMARLPANQQLDLGSLHLKRDPVTRDQDETVFAYQGMVGLSYEFSSPFQMYFGYRFFATDPLDPSSRTEGGERSESEAHAAHSGLIGFRYNF